jgi:MoxR-like ATPase
MELAELRDRAAGILDEVERAVVGKRGPLELILLALLSDGHVLIEDYPGLAKTLIARSFAQASSLRFARIQFTPDLMPSDVTGSSIFNQRSVEFEFRPGPIFANLLLADEINRAPPKTQAALLEAMQERQVTIENDTHRLEPPFLVLATASSSGSRSATPHAATRWRCWSAGSSAGATSSSCDRSSTPPRSSRCRERSSACTSRTRSRATSSTS